MSRPLLVLPFFHLVQFFPAYTMLQLHLELSILLQSHLASLTSPYHCGQTYTMFAHLRTFMEDIPWFQKPSILLSSGRLADLQLLAHGLRSLATFVDHQ